jgi:DNA modification methylase
MDIQTRKISDLKTHPQNPRVHPESALAKLEKSIKEFGWTNPVLLSKDGYVLAGHARLKAAVNAGLTEVPTIMLDLEGDKATAYLIADNKIQEETGWDEEKLALLMQELKDSGFDISLTGFDMDEVEKIFEEQFPSEVKEDDFNLDEALESIAKPITKLGDVWMIGKHKLVCGDSTLVADVNKLMNDERADMVFTDPPWNVNYGATDHPSWKSRTIMNDSMPTEDFKEFMNNTFKVMNEYSKEGCMTYVVMSAQEWGNMMLTLTNNEYHWSSTVIWNKDRLVLSRKDYHTKYEPIWYGWKEGQARLHPLDDRKQCDVWDIDRPNVSELHPTQKPVELVVKAIKNSSSMNDIVLDLFGGSGTTLIACEQTQRECRMMELDPKYCDVIVKRYVDKVGIEDNVYVLREGERIDFSKMYLI